MVMEKKESGKKKIIWQAMKFSIFYFNTIFNFPITKHLHN